MNGMNINLGHSLEQAFPLALALGGGGARGIAHIVVLEALDELGVLPIAISGTSMGAIIGALYCSGMSGQEIREFILDATKSKTQVWRKLLEVRVGQFTDVFRRGIYANPLLVDGEKFLKSFLPIALPQKLEELAIPLSVTATDFYARREVNFTKGMLLPAIAASMAIPGIVRPILHEGKVLIDGGSLNPLPVNLIARRGRFIVAVDVTDNSQMRDFMTQVIPDPLRTLYGSVSIMMEALTKTQLDNSPPDILVSPQVDKYHALDFFKAQEILDMARPVKDIFKRRLEKAIERELG